MESELVHDRTSGDSIQSNSVMAQYDYGSVPKRRLGSRVETGETRLDRLGMVSKSPVWLAIRLEEEHAIRDPASCQLTIRTMSPGPRLRRNIVWLRELTPTCNGCFDPELPGAKCSLHRRLKRSDTRAWSRGWQRSPRWRPPTSDPRAAEPPPVRIQRLDSVWIVRDAADQRRSGGSVRTQRRCGRARWRRRWRAAVQKI